MKRIFLIIFLIFCLQILTAEITPYHELPISFKTHEAPIIELEIQIGFNEIDKVYVYFREAGTLTFYELEMMKGTETDPYFRAALNDASEYTTELEYYFEIVDINELRTSFPEMQPQINPFRVAYEKPQEFSDSFVKLSPDSELSDLTEDFIIAISYFSITDEVEEGSIKMTLNGEDITENAKISKNLILYKDLNKLPGNYTYQVSAVLKNGKMINSEKWFTKIKEVKFEMPWNLTGNAVGTYYGYSESVNDETGNEGNLLINMSGSQKWLRTKLKLFISSLETKYAQPVNRYKISLLTPHFDLIAGDHSPDFGSFVVNNKNIRGIHTNLHFKFFRLLLSYGQNKRSIEGDETAPDVYSAGTFKRNTAAMRMEIGSKKSFLWGLNVAKNKDSIKSLDEKYYLQDDNGEITTLTTPADNLILGIDTRLALINQRLVWGTEVALSLYNSNIIGGALSNDDLDSLGLDADLPIDPADFEDIFILNEYVQPFMPGMTNLAYKTYLRGFIRSNSVSNLITLSYSGIGASYNSLSSSYLQNDSQIIGIYDNLSLLNNRLSLNLSFNILSDNLESQNEITNKSLNYSTQLLYKPVDYPYFRVGFNNNTSNNDADSTNAIDVQTTNINFGIGYEVETISFAPTHFSLGFYNSSIKDKEFETYDYKKNNVSLTAKSKFTELPLVTTFSLSFNMNDDKIFDSISGTDLEAKYNYNSIYLKGAMIFYEDKLRPFIDFKHTFFGGDAESQATQLLNLGTYYYFTPNTFACTDIGMKFYQNNDVEDSNYSTSNWRLKIGQKF